MSSEFPGAFSNSKKADNVTIKNMISMTERINPATPGTMPFLSLFFEITTPAIESGSAKNGSNNNKSIKIINAPLSFS